MRTAIYARISQDAEEQGKGVTRQLADCRAAAQTRGWDVTQEYVDNDVSATRTRVRPEYTRMLADITTGKINALVVYDVDRLTRTPRELEDIIDLAEAHGLALVSVGGEIDLSTPQGRLTARIKGSVARHETDQMSRRIKRKIQEKAENGEPHGMVPYGWTRVYDEDDKGRRAGGRDVINPPEAKTISDATNRILAGESLRSVTMRLNDNGFPSPRGGRWNAATLRQVLSRSTNAGLRSYKGEVVGKSTTEPIITEDDYYRLQAVLQDPSRRLQQGTIPRHLLTGIAECGLCRGKMRRLKGVARNGKTQPEAYGCRDCFKVRRRIELVDTVVEIGMLELLLQPDALSAMAAGDPANAQRISSRVEALSARMDMAADQFAEGDITGEQLARITAKLRPQLEAARAELASMAPLTAAATITGPDAVARWEDATLQTKRDLIDALMTVTILPAGPGRGRDPDSIRITWKHLANP